MTATPRAALESCLQSRLLRPICPRRVPLSLGPSRYDLGNGCWNAVHITLASPRCTGPVWSYEVFLMPPGQTPNAQVRAWDGRQWFSPSYATMLPPPYHVHVDIQASAGSPPPSISSPSFTNARSAARVSDALLNPARVQAASFGRVDWFGRRGELRLAPTNPNGGGEEAGHLIFYFSEGGVHYDISLHVWASKERFVGRGAERVVNAPRSGPALPHAIATLRAMVATTEAARG